MKRLVTILKPTCGVECTLTIFYCGNFRFFFWFDKVRCKQSLYFQTKHHLSYVLRFWLINILYSTNNHNIGFHNTLRLLKVWFMCEDIMLCLKKHVTLILRIPDYVGIIFNAIIKNFLLYIFLLSLLVMETVWYKTYWWNTITNEKLLQ